ncbi:NAD(P)H:quinone oxidoreductase [Nonomuraea sp. B10E15]|uniref:NAD(P)H:quinone oxidoreductase n=1 Tax=Nonomuraea sp. B10E15 TaxID=3153560 RepID=UPI00325E4ABF
MSEPVKTAVIYYSSTGNVHKLATALAEGAEKAGSDVRLRKVTELAPPQAIASNPQWAQHVESTRDVAEAGVDDLLWADVVLLGTPTRYGAMASQLKQFIDTTGPAWQKGLLADKVYGAFGSAGTRHGGHESTLLSLYTIFYHWGGIIVPPGYTHSIQFQVGTPYGTTHVGGDGEPGEPALESGRYQARRAVETAAKLKAGRS